MASVRYIVSDVGESVAFYRDALGFTVEMYPGPLFATLARGDLRLILSAPGAGGGGTAGGTPQPGGWNRIQIQADDLDALTLQLGHSGAAFRGKVVSGRGGRQILLEDPSGNLVELFEPAVA